VTVTENITSCSTTDSIYVIAIPDPIIPVINDTVCIGEQVRLSARPTNIADLDQFQKTTFSWSQNGNALSITDSILFATTTGVYTATVNIDRCPGSADNTIVVADFPTSELSDKTKFCVETDKFILLDAGNASNYVWETGNAADSNRTLSVSPTQDTYYYVQIGNQFDCAVRDSILVRNVCAPRVYIPNAFTPGVNGGDLVFKVFGTGFFNFKMVVYSRWGEAIFESTDRTIGWDGTYKGEPMPTGVYPVIITYEGRDEFSGQQKYTGQVTLIR
jgi:gliding motility-associated-like protein